MPYIPYSIIIEMSKDIAFQLIDSILSHDSAKTISILEENPDMKNAKINMGFGILYPLELVKIARDDYCVSQNDFLENTKIRLYIATNASFVDF